MHLGENCGSLVEYLKAFDVTLRVMQTEESLRRIAYELAEDAATRERPLHGGALRPDAPHPPRPASLTTVVESVLEGLRKAQDRAPASSRNVIICGIRNVSPESSLEMAELAVAYKGRGVVGFDLAGAEYDHPAKHHKAAFQLVRDNNINVTIHAGEAYGPESIAQAIHVCGAHRIGHGCRLRENGDLLHYVNDHRIPLECCPSSNVQTGAIRDLASHPLKLYKNLGLRVTVNTDNRLITDTTVSKELWLCHTQLGLSLKDIKQIILSRLQERLPAVPREAAVPAQGQRGARGVPRRRAYGCPHPHVPVWPVQRSSTAVLIPPPCYERRPMSDGPKLDRVFDALESAAFVAEGRRGERVVATVTVEEFREAAKLDPKALRARLDRVVMGEDPERGLDELLEAGALSALFPEVHAMVGFGDGEWRHKDVWKHTKQVVRQAVPRLEVRWAALFHDIGKVKTRSITADGKVHFLGHAEVGTRMFDKLDRRLGLFGYEPTLKDTVRFLVLHHLRANQYSPDWTDSAVRRFARELGVHLEDLLCLARADITTKRPEKKRKGLQQIEELQQRISAARGGGRAGPSPAEWHRRRDHARLRAAAVAQDRRHEEGARGSRSRRARSSRVSRPRSYVEFVAREPRALRI